MTALSSAITSAKQNVSCLLQKHFDYAAKPFRQLTWNEKAITAASAAASGALFASAGLAFSSSAATTALIYSTVLLFQSHNFASRLAKERTTSSVPHAFLRVTAALWKAYSRCTLPTIFCAATLFSPTSFATRFSLLVCGHSLLADRQIEMLDTAAFVAFGFISYFLLASAPLNTCIAVALSTQLVYRYFYPWPRAMTTNLF